MDKKKTGYKKIVALSLGALVVLGGGVAIGSQAFPKVITKEVVKEVPGPVEYKDVIKEVPVEKIVTVEKEVFKDNEKLADLLQFIYDEDGNIEYLTNDLSDKEVSQIADRFTDVITFKNLAIAEVEDKAFDELDNKVVNGTQLNDRDMSRLRLKDDFKDITLEDIDFDSGDATAFVNATFEHDDVKYDATFEVTLKDFKVDDVKVDSVKLH